MHLRAIARTLLELISHDQVRHLILINFVTISELPRQGHGTPLPVKAFLLRSGSNFLSSDPRHHCDAVPDPIARMQDYLRSRGNSGEHLRDAVIAMTDFNQSRVR